MARVLLLGGCSTSESTSDASADSADAALERRYLQACTQDSISGDVRVAKATCDCTLKAARKLYSRSELDMFVARRADDKVREKEILSRPDYDEKKFASKARELQGQALTCTLSRVVR